MTEQERRVRKAILAALPAHERKARVIHAHPTAYVVGRLAAKCLAVVVPDLGRNLPKGLRGQGVTVHRFFGDFKAGDWVSLAYVATPTSGEWIAVEWVE